MPEGGGADKITANYTDGVRTVKVTLPEETKPAEPQQIRVGVNTD